MLVYLAILVIVVSALSSLLLLMVHSNIKMKSMNTVAISAQESLDLLSYEIRHAEGVYTPTVTNNQLSLFTNRHAPTGEEDGYVDFFICDTRLCMKREGQNPVALTPENTEITQLEFSHVLSGLESSSIQIGIGISYKNPSNRAELTASVQLISTVNLRGNEQ